MYLPTVTIVNSVLCARARDVTEIAFYCRDICVPTRGLPPVFASLREEAKRQKSKEEEEGGDGE